MARVRERVAVGLEDEAPVLSAESVEGLLDKFLEYDVNVSAQQNDTVSSRNVSPQEKPSSTSQGTANAAVTSRKRRCQDSPLSLKTKKLCTSESTRTATASDSIKPTSTHYSIPGNQSRQPPILDHVDAHDTRIDPCKMIKNDVVSFHPSGVSDAALEASTCIVPRRKPRTRAEDIERKQSRRVVFLGNLPRTVSENQIFQNFSRFGEIEDISLHAKTSNQFFAFVTFKDRSCADKAVAEGSLPGLPEIEVSYGGRRHFCGQAYVDHDNHYPGQSQLAYRAQRRTAFCPSAPNFDDLLLEYRRSN